jgi:prepilin-type N-terminal cleavage/methylation domain-containing protein
MRKLMSGFTIVELLIVIIIIGILAAAGVGKYATFATDARVKTCLGNQAQLCQAVQVWQTKKVQVPRNGDNVGGGNHMWFSSIDGRWMGGTMPAQVSQELTSDPIYVRRIIDDINVFRCPENTSRYTGTRGGAAAGSNSGAGSEWVLIWFRDFYDTGWTPPNTDTSYVSCYSWGYNNGVWPDGSRATQHMSGWSN